MNLISNCWYYYLSVETIQLVLDKGKETYSKGTELEVGGLNQL